MNENQLRREMIETGKQLYEKSLIAAAEGNFSVRLDAQRILATPTGLCKGKMAADDLVIIDPDGNHISGERRASSEIKMHLEVYRRRPDAQAVIHAHPPICIALMLAGIGLDRPVLAENVVLMGKVPTAPYARP
ncbi:MAG: class II aldolase/adducin family protein, partial [Calditrichaeota bacterium]|nr:class II aldolase/adducin family protein [Calditrichota bacterium]